MLDGSLGGRRPFCHILVSMRVPTNRQMRRVWTIWIVTVVLIAISSLVPDLIHLPRTGMVTNFAARGLLVTLLPLLWRAQDGFYPACAAVLSAIALGGFAAFLVVALAVGRTDAYHSALQWSVGGIVCSALLAFLYVKVNARSPNVATP